jgi:membrane associated rhomboid family serine protease
MVKCDFCEDEIDYLPFTCRYCGKSYCKKHRIPENHQCSFEFRNDPYKVKSMEESKDSKIYVDYPAESVPRETSSRRERIRNSRIRDRMNRTRPQVTSLLGMQSKPYGTYGILIVNSVFFAISVTLAFLNLDKYIYLSFSDYVGGHNYWTILTSIFTPINQVGTWDVSLIREVSGMDIFFGLLYLFIKLFMLFFVGRMIETRWGWKTLVRIYIISGLFSSLGILLVDFIASLDPIAGFYAFKEVIQYQSSWGASMGLIAFIALIFPQQQVTMFLYFIPIRVKMKNLLWILIGISLVTAIFRMFVTKNPWFVQDLGGIAGILGGFIIFKSMRRNY